MGGFGIDWYISYTFYSTWEDCLSLIGRVMLSLWVWTIKIAWPVTYKINLRCVSWIPKSVVGYAKATGTFGTKSLTNSLAFSRKSYLSRWNVNKWNAINSIQCSSGKVSENWQRKPHFPVGSLLFFTIYCLLFCIESISLKPTKQYSLVDYFRYSQHLSEWQRIDIVRRI